ncbi:MAG: hypothetical protein JJO71_10290 [Escherichia coli]|nr:hypothetical protein [Escherichia coli]MBL0989746.1 hypothetical protein [Escherichia coli]MBL0999233.1 hypothetical protein [Escherichia coli]MBL1004043.1 hypothetical protein [Escherichia coli]
MKKELLFSMLSAVAANNKEGYTVDAATLQPITKGYSVAVAATQNSFGPEGLARVIEYAKTHKEVNAFGGWFNTDNGLYYYDATIVISSLADALELGRSAGQLAIFDLENCKEIRL